MKRIFINLLLLLSSVCMWGQEFYTTLNINELSNAPAKLIPYPKKISWDDGTCNFKSLQLLSNNIPFDIQSEWDGLLKYYNIPKNSDGLKVAFNRNNHLKAEEYLLTIDSKQINIEASGEKGWFYALQTLRQMIDKNKNGFSVPLARIRDYPDFAIRGFMLDVGRNFQTIDFLKKQIDVLSQYKMNVFQWHLTDYPAWRIETKTHPELIAAKNHRPTRDPGKYYTIEEIKDLFNYAKAKQVQIIPEIDMPGHSTYFKQATGHTMDSEEGKQILKDILKEFFNALPSEICPYVHLGSDEVKIENPKAFMDEMIGFVRSYNRQPIAWTPGLPADANVIAQIWKPDHVTKNDRPVIDSWHSYINNSEPLTQMPKLLLKPIGKGSGTNVLGGILCLWHDVNLDNNEEVFDFHSVYPAILTYAWRTWSNDVKNTDNKYLTQFPNHDSFAYDYTVAFEDYLITHGKKYFKNYNFYYTQQSGMNWTLKGPYSTEMGVLTPSDSLQTKTAVGGTIIIKDRFKEGGYFPEAKVNQTYTAVSYIFSEKKQTKMAWVGFETPLRANRIYQGIPQAGKWDTSNGTVKINGKDLPAPKWKKPGFQLSQKAGWGNAQDKEIPWDKEELYWTRPAVPIKLEKGWNKVEITCPGTHDYQNWMFTFIFLDFEGVTSHTTQNK